MPTSESFQGMRWYKCDFQMQTPADARHWLGTKMERTADGTAIAAKAYAQRCYAVGLECICVTEHNFLGSKEFLPALETALVETASELGVEPITLFPGFEITANVGFGCHVLGVFNPGSDLTIIDHKVTECGVPASRQNAVGDNAQSRRSLPEIIDVVQKSRNEAERGLIICAHPMTKDGLFDGVKIAEWLQMAEWSNPDLLAVEVPRPIDKMSRNWQTLFGNGEGCLDGWKRERPMACVFSSDCKALTSTENAGNYIGKRHCWVKMSKPSVEALRQAFLDPGSRIRLQEARPEAGHGYVESMSVGGMAFLADQTISFSPGLNCIIGGRGCGKSSLLECLRLGLGADANVPEGEGSARKQVERIKGTMPAADSKITVRWRKGDVPDTFERAGRAGGDGCRVVGRAVDDHATVFKSIGVQVFSQREISERVSDKNNGLLALLDGLCADGLVAIGKEAEAAAAVVRRLLLSRDELARQENDIRQTKQRVADLQRDLDAKVQVQEEGRKQRAALDEEKLIRQFDLHAAGIKDGVTRAVAAARKRAPAYVGDDPLGNYAVFAGISSGLDTAADKLAVAVGDAVRTFEEETGALLQRRPDAGVSVALAKVAAAKDAFAAACARIGVRPEEVEKIKAAEESLGKAKEELAAKMAAAEISRDEAAMLGKAYEGLTKAWMDETSERTRIVSEIESSGRIPKSKDGTPLVKVRIEFAGDKSDFIRAWSELRPDKRKRAGQVWDDIGAAIFDGFAADRGGAGNPTQWLLERLNDQSRVPQSAREHITAIVEAIAGKHELLGKLLVTRNRDSADLELNRNDGTQVGTLSSGRLSDGQRNTAVLSLLLARGDGPIIIDQPEDELDSEFLFSELVPLLRETKAGRQVIVVTHNANIPVNADAELIYALKASSGRGVPDAVGALDRQEVSEAVLRIMEGTREAFRRRREKYNF